MRFITTEREQNNNSKDALLLLLPLVCTYFFTSNSVALLARAQEYFLRPSAGYPTYATASQL